MAFEEKKFEELLAYQSSPRRLTRYLGPLLQSAFESRLLIYLIATLLIMDLFLLFQSALTIYFGLMWLKILPLLLLVLAFWRLQKHQEALKLCRGKLEKLFGGKAPYVLYRLTDDEIVRFSQESLEKTTAYIQENQSLRWRAIKASYSN